MQQKAFDFSTTEILDWELKNIDNALLREEIRITKHAQLAAQEDNVSFVQLFEAILVGILVGIPVSKDLPDNKLNRIPGINYEHKIKDGRWIRIKVAWLEGYAVITVYQI